MSTFDEEPVQRGIRKETPWPIKLAMKYGVKSEKQANTIVMVISVILIVITFFLYKDLYTSSNNDDVQLKDITFDDWREMKKHGATTEVLTPEMKKELEERGIDISKL